MKKKRIKEVIDSNGISKFYVQGKIIFWWEDYIAFKTKEEAEKYMNYRTADKIKYHY